VWSYGFAFEYPTLGLASEAAFVSLPGPGCGLPLEAAVGFLKGQIAHYILPQSIERFEELPLTRSGKIRRHVLRDWVLARHNAPASSTRHPR